MSIRCCISYLISTQCVSTIQIKIKKNECWYIDRYISRWFFDTSQQLHFSSSTKRAYNPPCLLLSPPFHFRNPPPSARALLSTLPCPVAARVFPTIFFIFLRWRVVLPSLKAKRRDKVILSICIDEVAP
jgi:hypothetical protein